MKIHIIGICGRVCGPLANALVEEGHILTGSDDRPMPPVSDYLEKHGISCFPSFNADQVPADCDLVLVNSFYGKGNPELETALARKLPVSHFPKFLSERYLSKTRNVVVAGSYGKTSTTGMLAWILLNCGKNPGWLIGGVCPNLGEYLQTRSDGVWVVEGDEYPCGFEDPSPKFRYYNPAVGILTALDYVHQDIFGTYEEMEQIFREFLVSVKEVSFVAEGALPVILPINGPLIQTVGLGECVDRRITGRIWEAGWNRFRFMGEDFRISLRGAHSCVNAALACCAAEVFGVSPKECATALSEFSGVDSRQEVFINNENLILVHDSAIYPKSIGRVVESVRECGLDRRFCVLFHPRNTLGDCETYYRELGESFSCVDVLLVADPVNQSGMRAAFEFDLEKLKNHLHPATCVSAVGPTMKCFEQWRSFVEPGDVWLILVEPIFPEPTATMRGYCKNLEK